MFKLSHSQLCLLSIVIGIGLGSFCNSSVFSIAQIFSDILVRIMRFLCVPLIFFSLFSTILQTNKEGSHAGKLLLYTMRYTLGTTLIAASVGLLVYILINPADGVVAFGNNCFSPISDLDYSKHAMNIIPVNIIDIFISNNVAGAVLISVVFGFVGKQLHQPLSLSLSQAVLVLSELFLKLAGYVVKSLPIFLWAFVVLFLKDLTSGFVIGSIISYIFVVMIANSIQAFIVLPLLLKKNGFNVRETMKKSLPALSIAALSKSSNLAIPTSLQVAVEKHNVQPSIARFTIPVCATINMNGCSIFIFTTSIFMIEVFTQPLLWWQYLLGIVVATFVAIGNAGVPMGCFFLTTSILSMLDIPTYMMGALLPFFTILDMFETGINVWSDLVITRCIDKKLSSNT